MNVQATKPMTDALLKSILMGPLLLGDLPESKRFCRSQLALPIALPKLNFQQKLGHLFEDAFACLIPERGNLRLIQRNLQLRDQENRTVGELDFLLRDRASHEIIHLELATKFYLAVATNDKMSLPGPDARDNYFRKVSRMREHQLRLPAKYRACLPEAYRGFPIITRQLVYGCLFDHLDAKKKFHPKFSLSNCRRGKWMHQQDCDRYFESGANLEVIPKSLWAVPLENLANVSLAPWHRHEKNDRCVMVRSRHDITPYFIAPANYPHQQT